jgi:hypothetical protein
MKEQILAPSTVCPKCKMRSYHSKDIEFKYCANCNEFYDGSKRILGGIKVPKGKT